MSGRASAPIWARTLDIVCLLLAAGAAIVAVSGGFRAHAGSLRIGVTSPLPLLLWSLGIGVARHLAAPQQPLYREFPARVAEWARLPAVRTAAIAALTTRAAMFAVGYLAVFMIGFANAMPHRTAEERSRQDWASWGLIAAFAVLVFFMVRLQRQRMRVRKEWLARL